ncbi:hypothetical protein NMY22_g2462 [Coprinellus aureogranulatus]|nr:hypothetical protein NMY22_g2462 [Coprinellus aureogranulatus]
MSSTVTETQQPPTTGAQAPPEITILTRVASIPMIHSGLETLSGTLLANAYTRSTYNTAKELTTSAYKLTEPLQIKLAPLIVRADDYANKAVDAVESRYPYPFKAKPEDVAALVNERKQSASGYVQERIGEANKALDERVKNPAFNVAHDLDQRLAPLVDYFQNTVSGFQPPSEAGSSSPNPEYQYQRALALSKTLKDSLYEYTAEQLKHVQAQSAIMYSDILSSPLSETNKFCSQRASETAESITTLASSSFAVAQTRIHTLSENMLVELQKLQKQTNTLSASIQSTVQSSKSQLQTQLGPQIQQTYTEISSILSATISDLNEVLRKKDMPLPEKVSLVGKEVRERVSPVLETIRKGIFEILARGKEVMQSPPTSASQGEKEPQRNDVPKPVTPPTEEELKPGEETYAEKVKESS